MSAPTDKWSASRSGEWYSGQRFASRRAAERDPRAIERLLRRHGVRGALLDAPCGTGRLAAQLSSFEAPLVSLDLSAPMLAIAARQPGARLVRARIEALPFEDRTFDVVVSCRFLHHLHGADELRGALSELVRVSSRLVVASFWDAGSLPTWRVRLGWKRSEGPRGRTALSRARLEGLLEGSGARVVEYAATLRFLSQQTFFVAERI